MYTIELRDVADPTRFQQSLLFSACSVSDEEAAIRMLTHLLEQGVDDEAIAWTLTDHLVTKAQAVFRPIWEKTAQRTRRVRGVLGGGTQ